MRRDIPRGPRIPGKRAGNLTMGRHRAKQERARTEHRRVSELEDRIAVVTGGASGIGRACCQLLEASGARAYVVDLSGAAPIDVTDRGGLEDLAAGIGERDGRLDILINAAGVLPENRSVDDVSIDDFRISFEVNLLGTLLACQAFGPLLKEQRGAVVNVAAQGALVSLPSQAAYTASKGAVAALTRAIAIDWAPYGVRVNAVAPGVTLTPMTQELVEDRAFLEAATRRIPLGRPLRAEEIAAAIVFLASPLSSAITGVVLPVDGGWTAGEPAFFG